jgi:hypothetical protein
VQWVTSAFLAFSHGPMTPRRPSGSSPDCSSQVGTRPASWPRCRSSGARSRSRSARRSVAVDHQDVGKRIFPSGSLDGWSAGHRRPA